LPQLRKGKTSSLDSVSRPSDPLRSSRAMPFTDKEDVNHTGEAARSRLTSHTCLQSQCRLRSPCNVCTTIRLHTAYLLVLQLVSVHYIIIQYTDCSFKQYRVNVRKSEIMKIQMTLIHTIQTNISVNCCQLSLA